MVKKFDPALLPEAPDFQFENELWQSGVRFVAGVDEAGRGALAGPVYAAVLVLLPASDIDQKLLGVRDSKQLSPVQRQHWAARLRQQAYGYGIGLASHLEIDEMGIVKATQLAIQRALTGMTVTAEHLLLDYMARLPLPLPQTILVKGDARSLSIAGASILAKTERDAHMLVLDQQYPGFGFASHKGYGTLKHRQAIKRLGLSPVHRQSYQIRDEAQK
jgi:ribonuclease HII